MRKLDTPLARGRHRGPRLALRLRRPSRMDHARRAARDAAAAARQAAGEAAVNTRDAVGAALDGAMRDLTAPPPPQAPATPTPRPTKAATTRRRRVPLLIRAPWFVAKTAGRSVAGIVRHGPLVLVGLAGAAAAHLLDPENGARRRAAAAERLGAAADKARSAAGQPSAGPAASQHPDAPTPTPPAETSNTIAGANNA